MNESKSKKFLTKDRRKWLSKYFQTFSLLAAAGVVGEGFLRLPTIWRSALIIVSILSFVLGLYFSEADSNNGKEEE